MSYIGNQPTTVAFLTDTFSGNGSTTAFTMSVAPATTSSVLVAVTGVLQSPDTYSVVGTTLTFSAAPPSGTSNISVRYLGIPASGVTTTAYRTITEFTATAGQTTFSVPSYTVGYIDVYRNGLLLGSSDFTATSGTTVILASACTVGDFVETVSFYVSSVLNAIPASPSSVGTSYLVDGSVTTAKILDANVTSAKLASGAARSNFGAGAVLQVVQTAYTAVDSTTSIIPTMTNTSCTATITPASASNKVLVMLSMVTYHVNVSSTMAARIMRGTSAAFSGITGDSWASGGGGTPGNINIQWLDSPSTTSATTYTAQFATSTGTGQLNKDYFGNNNGVTYLTLLEIAA